MEQFKIFRLYKKGFIILLFLLGYNFAAQAQSDSVVVVKQNDTVKIGGVIILRDGNKTGKKRVVVSIEAPHSAKGDKVTTSFLFFDIGFSNWKDKTDYSVATTGGSLVNRPGASALNKKDFRVQSGKSINFDLWLAAQKISLIKRYVNLKYALGLELNNYRFDENISFSSGGITPYPPQQDIDHGFVFRDSVNFRKNKLAADYVTVPVMLNFNSNPEGEFGLNLSIGISVGYLFGSRNKQVSAERGKQKNHGNFDLRRWKYAYEADLGFMKSFHLYGTYTPKSVFKNDLNFRPYSLGVRYSPNW